MRIIISPAKKMKIDDNICGNYDAPVLLDDTKKILNTIKSLSLEQMQKIWGCNKQLALQNYERFQNMKLNEQLMPAILAYEGIQYQYMAPTVFENHMFSYISENLRILSGFYGVLKPMDGVSPYRLEMQSKLALEGYNNLYDFWDDKLYKNVIDDSHVIINLASKEYSKCIQNHLKAGDKLITCVFGQLSNGTVIQKGTYAKIARGEMVRFLAQHEITDLDEIKKFREAGYEFLQDLSNENEYVFIK